MDAIVAVLKTIWAVLKFVTIGVYIWIWGGIVSGIAALIGLAGVVMTFAVMLNHAEPSSYFKFPFNGNQIHEHNLAISFLLFGILVTCLTRDSSRGMSSAAKKVRSCFRFVGKLLAVVCVLALPLLVFSHTTLRGVYVELAPRFDVGIAEQSVEFARLIDHDHKYITSVALISVLFLVLGEKRYRPKRKR